MKRKFKPLKRETGRRIPKQKFILYTEGENTEPVYFKGLVRSAVGALIELEIIDGAGTPMTIADAASTRAKNLKSREGRSSFEENDQIWAVFDRDEHPYVSEASQKCVRAGVQIAFSNPCFELWLILHLSNFDRPDDRHQVQKHLESICADYDRARRKTVDVSKFIPHVELAERRAEQQFARRVEEGNPPAPPPSQLFIS